MAMMVDPRQQALSMALQKAQSDGGGQPPADPSAGGQQAQQPDPSQQQGDPSQQQQPGQIPQMMGEIAQAVKSGKLPPDMSQKIMQALQQLAGVYQKLTSAGKDPSPVIGPKVMQLYQYVEQTMQGAGGQQGDQQGGQQQGGQQPGANLAGAA